MTLPVIVRRREAAEEMAELILDAYGDMVTSVKELAQSPRYELDEQDLAALHRYLGRAFQAEFYKRLKA